MLSHMVALVLLSMVAFLTIFLLAENLQQPIRVFEIGGYWSCHGEQNASYHVRGQKSVSENGVKSDLAFCLRPFIKKTNSDTNVHLGLYID